MEKTKLEALKAELQAQAKELNVSPDRLAREIGNNSSLLTDKSTKFIDVKWNGKGEMTHLRFITDGGEVCTLSNLLTFGVPVAETKKSDLIIEKSTSTGKLAGTFVLKGTRCFNAIASGQMLDVALSLLDKPFTVEAIDCHVGGFQKIGEKIGFTTEKSCRDNLKVKTLFKLNF